jgi:hypothetical protein
LDLLTSAPTTASATPLVTLMAPTRTYFSLWLLELYLNLPGSRRYRQPYSDDARSRNEYLTPHLYADSPRPAPYKLLGTDMKFSRPAFLAHLDCDKLIPMLMRS